MEVTLPSPSSISSLISAAEHGDQAAAESLFGTLYAELHRLSKRELARQGIPVSLSATTLLHQAYSEMAGHDCEIEDPVDHRELIQISEVLDELSKADPLLSEVVDLKFFCGFTFAEFGTMKGISERTVQRQWEKARIYLHRKIRANLET